MGLTFNGTSVTAVNYNGTALSKISFNGTEVWSSGPSIPITNKVWFQPVYTEGQYYTNLSFNNRGSNTYTFIVSTNEGSSWTEITALPNQTTFLGETYTNTKIYIGGINSNGFTDSSGWASCFSIIGLCKVGGNLHSLIDYTTENIPDTSTIASCFSCLFEACSALTDASALILPYQNTPTSCYSHMFSMCENLVTAPTTDFTDTAAIFGISTFEGMFYGCTSLTMPLIFGSVATFRNKACYEMYRGCTALNKLPVICATTIGQQTFYRMFMYCSNIVIRTASATAYPNTYRVPMLGTATDGYQAFYQMFSNTSSSSQTVTPSVNTTYYTSNGIVGDYLCFTAVTAGAMVYMGSEGTITTGATFQSSRDCITWSTFTPGSHAHSLTNIGDKVYFRSLNNTNGINTDYSNYYYFETIGTTAVSGNIMSLIDGYGITRTIPNDWCFTSLFQYNDIISAPSLPATTLTDGCYYNMFYNCEYLATAPKLPALSIPMSAYNMMFCACQSLIKAPELPATTFTGMNCYYNMFLSCSHLTTAPIILPALTLTDSCYSNMFKGCSSLTTIPLLPATTLDSYCYSGMFRGCSSLQISDTQTSSASHVWRVPSNGTFTNTYIQKDMFTGCAGTRSSNNMSGAQDQSYTYYTQNTPAVDKDYLCFTALAAPSTVDFFAPRTAGTIANSAYSRDGVIWTDFTPAQSQGTNTITLSKVGEKVYFRNDILSAPTTTYQPNVRFKVLGSVAASGNINSIYDSINFETLTTLSIDFCFYSLFNLSRGLTDVSQLKLPALVLSKDCYGEMFINCENITIPPELPATTLAEGCYYSMFNCCSSLTSIPKLPAAQLATGAYQRMFYGCNALQISNQATSTAQYVWRLPQAGTYSATYNQVEMFTGCAGTHSLDNMPGAAGSSYIYYTQNAPV